MTLRIVIHNVGHGQAIHAFTPNGLSVVIDLGRSGEFSPLQRLHSTTEKIDLLVITHPHGDHIDEILELDKYKFNVRQVWRPKWLTDDEIRDQNKKSDTKKVEQYLRMFDSFEPIKLEQDKILENPGSTGGVNIKMFTTRACGRSEINNHSGVVLFNYHGFKVIIPGDNQPPSWNELLKQPDFVKAAKTPDIFMASHHGRESGYTAELFDARTGIGKPRLCVVSDGRVQDTDATNRYSYQASGMSVSSRSGKTLRNPHRCITTRTHGFIDITIKLRPAHQTLAGGLLGYGGLGQPINLLTQPQYATALGLLASTPTEPELVVTVD